MGKLGISRRLSTEDIEKHLKEGGSARYLQVQCALDVA
jgi:xanthine dehydrogenase accessory factor